MWKSRDRYLKAQKGKGARGLNKDPWLGKKKKPADTRKKKKMHKKQEGPWFAGRGGFSRLREKKIFSQ